MKNFKNIRNHILFWTLFAVYLMLTGPIKEALLIRILTSLFITCSYIFIYYSQLLFILPRFYKKTFLLMSLIGIDFLIYYLLYEFIYKVIPESLYTEMGDMALTPLYKGVIKEFILFCLISAVALGAYQNRAGINRIKIKREKEKLVLIKESGFIKNQFNSHVTFNFLNYCYSKVHKHSRETSEAIEIFSKMLRYSLSCKMYERVLLSKEIEHMEDFIQLQTLLNAEMKVVFVKHGNGEVYILPGILMNVVENAFFKHGNLNPGNQPIFIKLHAEDTCVTLTVENEKPSESLEAGYGNMKRYLDLLCKNRHTLDIDETDARYKVELKLMI